MPRVIAILLAPLIALVALPTPAQQWNTNASLPVGVIGPALAYGNGFLYQAGGKIPSQTNTYSTNVYYAKFYADGTPGQLDGSTGPWQPAPPLPTPVAYAASLVNNGYLYVLGGSPSSIYPGTNPSTVFYSAINSDGTLNQWQTNTFLPGPLSQLTAFVWSNAIYVAGSYTPLGGHGFYIGSATINADGTLSPWTQRTLPLPITSGSMVCANGIVYLLYCNNGMLQTFADCAKINPDGSLSEWQTAALWAGIFPYIGVVSTNGCVFGVSGGNPQVPFPTGTNILYSAPFAGDGSLAAWSAGPVLPRPLSSAGITVAGPYVVVTGGAIVNFPVLTNLQASASVYSIALPSPPTAPSLVAQGTSTNGNFQIQLSSTTNTGFGISASSDFANWTNIGWGFTDTNGLLTFPDTNAANFSNRFYKAYWPLP